MESKTDNNDHDPFYEIKNRLYELSTGFMFVEFTPQWGFNLVKKILPKIQTSSYDVHICQLETLLQNISKLEQDEEKVIRNVIADEYSFFDLDKETVLNNVRKELAFFKTELQNTLSELEKRQQSYIVPLSKNPYKTSLTTSELAYLFKALEKQGIIKIPDNSGKNFAKRLSELFVSKNPSLKANSPKKISDYYYSPEPDAAKRWIELFGRLKVQASEDSQEK